MSVELRSEKGGYTTTYYNGGGIVDAKVPIETLPAGTDVAPFHPTPAPGSRSTMEISPLIKVEPFKLHFFLVGVNTNIPVFTLRHAQFPDGLPIEQDNYDAGREKGKLYPLDDSGYEIEDHPF